VQQLATGRRESSEPATSMPQACPQFISDGLVKARKLIRQGRGLYAPADRGGHGEA